MGYAHTLCVDRFTTGSGTNSEGSAKPMEGQIYESQAASLVVLIAQRQ